MSQRTPSPNDVAASHIGNYQLPTVPREREFSSSFQGLTLESSKDEPHFGANFDHTSPLYLDEGRNSENVADRNMSAAGLETPSIRLLPQKRPSSESKSQPLIPHVDQHSGNVADWNIVRNDDPVVESKNAAPPPLKVKKRNSHINDATLPQDSYASRDVSANEASKARDSSWSVTPLDMEGFDAKSPFGQSEVQKARDPSWSITPLAMEGHQDKSPFESGPNTPLLETERTSLDKPLPPTPSTIAPRTPTSANAVGGGFKASANTFNHDKQDSANPLNLDQAKIYRYPSTRSMHEEQAPAVKHERIVEKQHEVQQHVITREVHDHDVYHRVLPIKDIEVKPARHFVPVSEGYLELDEEDIPSRTREKTNWAIAEFVSKSMPDNQGTGSARQFTARTFEGTDGDDKEYVGPEGYPVKEKWWVHPPTLEQNTAGTHPFHLGCEDPKDDGLHAKLPAGNVVGISKRLMEKRSQMDLD